MKLSYLILILVSTIFTFSCNGPDVGKTKPPVDSDQVEGNLDADLSPDTENFAIGDATSGKDCKAALRAAKSARSRIIGACKLAELAFQDARIITFNADYKATGPDYKGTDAVHTGVDLQGHPKPSNSRIVSMLAGTVVGINEKYGQVVTLVTLNDGTKIQIAYLHMKDIAVTLGPVSKGSVLGVESGKSSTPLAAHLHIGMRKSTTDGSLVLSTNASSSTWIYALDPLVYADAIYTTATAADTPQYSLSVVKSGAGSGTVSSDLSGISCGLNCSYAYQKDTLVTLTATENSGSTFGGWSGGGCSGTGSCIVIMSSATEVYANFNVKPVVPSLSITTASLSSATVGTGYSATITASGGQTPYSWSVNGLPSGLTNNSGSISGTPTTAGTVSVTVTVTDSSSPQKTHSITLSLTVAQAPIPRSQSIF